MYLFILGNDYAYLQLPIVIIYPERKTWNVAESVVQFTCLAEAHYGLFLTELFYCLKTIKNKLASNSAALGDMLFCQHLFERLLKQLCALTALHLAFLCYTKLYI